MTKTELLELIKNGESSGVEFKHDTIDNKAVREMVEEVLEGGKDAFEMRRLKYGF